MAFDKLSEFSMRQHILQAAKKANISLPSPLSILRETHLADGTVVFEIGENKSIIYKDNGNGTAEITFQ